VIKGIPEFRANSLNVDLYYTMGEIKRPYLGFGRFPLTLTAKYREFTPLAI
jgi:hypothetical protein